MSWTDERIDLLQSMWLQGMSASRIAKELANGLTRNAVIGKVYRLGLSGRAKTPSATVAAHSHPRPQHKSTPRPSAPRPSSPMVQGNTALAMQPMASAAPAPAPNKEVVVAMAEPVTIMDLRESMCRWPIGDPTASEFRFCGAKKIPGVGPYCACHAGVAYQPQLDRRRQRPVQKTG
ncbi:GcrA family cell cycle regulator [Methylocapsa palsarum]|uniref:GcrA cell cycle regulator n=1 Tax=Methylocapsa palsarum TaxID=1612308 RepID=A0A1I3XCC0_9HYPH|nr:GcrA family cell cycle regulator [Methylocapsa palsarum]SFK17218.1 GcrA cell cycle regulator [Methylocapsa palsarum]